MQVQSDNVNFGMAMYSPTRKAMPYFNKYLAQGTGNIDTKALGDFIIKQSKNDNADIKFLHTANGDIFEVFSNKNPMKKVTIPCKNTKPTEPEPKGFIAKARAWYKNMTTSYKYDPQGSWDNLPPELKQAGEAADKMEKEITKQ